MRKEQYLFFVNCDSGCVFYYFQQELTISCDCDRTIIPGVLAWISFCYVQKKKWIDYETFIKAVLQGQPLFKYHKFIKLSTNAIFFVKCEMLILFPLNCERTNLFSVKVISKPPLPPSSNRFQILIRLKLLMSMID